MPFGNSGLLGIRKAMSLLQAAKTLPSGSGDVSVP